jgi:hypothetical protein
MSSKWRKGAVLVGGILMLTFSAWAQRGQARGPQGIQNPGTCQAVIDTLPKQDLNAKEVEGLTYMREEEKLARDVYSRLFSKWGLRVFSNINRSEQRHFEALKVLLDRYELPDPAANGALGVFSDPRLSTLYGELVALGETSLAAALRVGATIEDLDIHDLNAALAATDNEDMKMVYGNLLAGSESHIRAFVGQLQLLGESYSAQYISASELEEILSAEPGTGRGNGRVGDGTCLSGQGNGTPGTGVNCTGQGTGTCPYGNTPGSSAGKGSGRPF